MEFYTDKVVWITGASSGIGAELAIQLSKQQAALILSARNQEALQEIQRHCLQYTTRCTVLPADLTDAAHLDGLVQQALQTYGHIDILINNAGITQRAFAEDTSPEVDRRIMEINFFSPVNLTKLLLPHFRARKTGQVAVLSSMAGLMGFPQRTAYAAAKHALKGYFETLQVEHSIPGFYATIVSPGRIQTPISLNALTASGKPHNKMDAGQQNGIPVTVCAQKILRAIARQQHHIVIARSERILWWFHKWCPPLYYRIARKAGLKEG
ncbi:SDR family oxidoreductase [Chitinophaga sp. XS-30]|uniref:SDR family oxidoreductase n=1 Tax=Chitinophaga sp. XS-30 TaxID=2604421 RepID=UPI0011DDCF1C|nr:SDR family oxidoreductase [Chitinophaga sp. XS-30]QEH42517.1 SDR family oxidoreductase [Chitinophaga sp. XS-30]